MLATLMLLQAVAGSPPDIELRATVQAKSLTIEKSGGATLTVTTHPPGDNIVEIEAPAASGRKTIVNPVIDVDVQARIAQPAQGAEPAQPPR